MNGKRKRFSGFWAIIGAFVLLMAWGTPTHRTFGFLWVAGAACLAALFFRSGADERGRIFRDQVLGFAVGTGVLTFYFALDGRTYITFVGALLTVIACVVSRQFDPRPDQQENAAAPAADGS